MKKESIFVRKTIKVYDFTSCFLRCPEHLHEIISERYKFCLTSVKKIIADPRTEHLFKMARAIQQIIML